MHGSECLFKVMVRPATQSYGQSHLGIKRNMNHSLGEEASKWLEKASCFPQLGVSVGET